MKKLILSALFLVTSFAYSQTQTAVTASGEEVLLKDDKTWEYVNAKSGNDNACVPKSDFEEPKWLSTKIRTRNKTRVIDLKNFVAKDTGVDKSKIILLKHTDTSAYGKYFMCVDGKKITYKRNGAVFTRD